MSTRILVLSKNNNKQTKQCTDPVFAQDANWKTHPTQIYATCIACPTKMPHYLHVYMIFVARGKKKYRLTLTSDSKFCFQLNPNVYHHNVCMYVTDKHVTEVYTHVEICLKPLEELYFISYVHPFTNTTTCTQSKSSIWSKTHREICKHPHCYNHYHWSYTNKQTGNSVQIHTILNHNRWSYLKQKNLYTVKLFSFAIIEEISNRNWNMYIAVLFSVTIPEPVSHTIPNHSHKIQEFCTHPRISQSLLQNFLEQEHLYTTTLILITITYVIPNRESWFILPNCSLPQTLKQSKTTLLLYQACQTYFPWTTSIPCTGLSVERRVFIWFLCIHIGLLRIVHVCLRAESKSTGVCGMSLNFLSMEILQAQDNLLQFSRIITSAGHYQTLWN